MVMSSLFCIPPYTLRVSFAAAVNAFSPYIAVIVRNFAVPWKLMRTRSPQATLSAPAEQNTAFARLFVNNTGEEMNINFWRARGAGVFNAPTVYRTKKPSSLLAPLYASGVSVYAKQGFGV